MVVINLRISVADDYESCENMKKRMNLQGKLFGLSFSKLMMIVLILVGCTLSAFYLNEKTREFEHEARINAIELAETAEIFISADSIKTFDVSMDDIDNIAYQQLKESLIRFKESTEGVVFSYLYTVDDEKVIIMVDSEWPESEDYSPPGQEYYEATADVIVPFYDGESHFSGPITDRWGTWYSVFVPIIEMNSGETVAVFGMDYSADEWNHEIINHMIPSIIMTICIILLSVSFYAIIIKNLTLNHLKRKLENSQSLFQAVFEQAPIGIAIVHSFDFLSTINNKFEQILDRSKVDFLSFSWVDITHPDDLDKDLELFEKFKTGEINGYTMDKRYIKPDGSSVWVEMTVVGLIENGKPSNNHICIVQDINQRKKAIEALHESERSKSVLLAHLPGMAYRCCFDQEWTMKFISEGCKELTGYAVTQLIENKEISFNEIIAPEYRAKIWDEWDRVIKMRCLYRDEYEIITAAGNRKWVLEIGQPVCNDFGEVIALEGIIIDVHESKMNNQKILYMIDHDYMTGLKNRKYYEEAKIMLDLENLLPVSIMIADINGVRMINDTLGIAEGDKLIKNTADLIKSCCQDQYVVARTGGDEFTILMPNADEAACENLRNHINQTCEIYNVSKKETAMQINLSTGYATKLTIDISLDAVEKEAEDYLLKRKLLEGRSHHNAMLSSMMASMYSKSQETEEHAIRIAEISKRIGLELNLSSEDMDDLVLFSMLHDIGKIGIDDGILNKPGKLSGEEWRAMKKHPEIGYRIAMVSTELQHIAEYILSHHERYDGNGYPRGLKGEEIPRLSRILALADAYDAMTGDRIYRQAIGKEQALEEIRRNVGTQFDPEIAKIFLEII